MNQIFVWPIFFWPLFLYSVLSVGQIDTTLLLNPVTVSAPVNLRQEPVGSRTENWDSSQLAGSGSGNLSDLLATQSNIYIKSYSLGSLATSAIRGGSAGHTAILWNGLPLQSPMLGLLDLGLLRTGLVDQVQLQYGGSASLWGSGAIGGVIKLTNTPRYGQYFGVDVLSSGGSFGRWDHQITGQFATPKLIIKSRLFNVHADNDYTYSIRPGLPPRTRTNAAMNQWGILQEIHLKPSSRQQWDIYYWRQETYREIPPTTTQNSSQANQEDLAHRAAIHWQRAGKKHVLQSRLGFYDEIIDYRDDEILLRAVTQFRTAIGELSGRIATGTSGTFQWGINGLFSKAFADNYADPPEELQTALFAAFRREFGGWVVQLNARQGWVGTSSIPFLPSLGLQGEIRRGLWVRAKISRNYRIPTMNDRYWVPGGMSDLLPEKGWSEELTLDYRQQKRFRQFTLSITGFNRNIDDWILWGIREGDRFFSAGNIAKVWSRGLEFRVSQTWSRAQWQLGLKGGYDFIRSTNEIAIKSPSIDAGEQLLYVPVHQAFGSARLQWNDWLLVYRHGFTGRVQGISDGVAGYQTGLARLTWKPGDKRLHWQLFLVADNLWNAQYRIIERHPMPGRNFQLGARLHWQSKTDK